MIKDYYKILNVDRQASTTDIKKAFRTLALQWHPDKNRDPNAKDIFIQINEAYEILSDETKRQNYNLLYADYFLKKDSLANSSNRKYEYERYNEWKNEAINKAYERAKMSFNDFTKFVNDIVKGIAWGCNTIFMIVLWISWGPCGLYYGGEGLYEMILEMQVQGFRLNFILMILLFLFSCLVTVGGLLAFKKALREGKI